MTASVMSIPEERMNALHEEAEKFKAEGNKHFQNNSYTKAVVMYTKAINLSEISEAEPSEKHSTAETEDHESVADSLLDECTVQVRLPNLHVYYSNRAFCHIKLENLGSAISDADKAIELNQSFSKAYYRRGCAKFLLGKYKEASKDFASLCKLAPNDPDARAKLKEAKKLATAEAFAAAIEKGPASSEIDWSKLEVSPAYSGPAYSLETVQKDPAPFLDALLEWQREEKLLDKVYVYRLLVDVIALLRKEASMRHVTIPEGKEMTVCGDIHGQYYDLLNIFKLNGKPSKENPYLFNGDFVDRGSFSVECILALFAYKVAYPDHFFLARGNHESRNMSGLYGFGGEVRAKYEPALYEVFMEAFCLLPLAHTINKQIFVVHGGLFKRDGVTLKEIEEEHRDREPGDEGLMTEMLWSDPMSIRGRAPSKRGVGVMFGPEVTDDFLKTNGLSMVIRSHEMQEEGYSLEHNGKLVTVFSAPNYCDQMQNKGAFIRLKVLPQGEKGDAGNIKLNYTKFNAVPHPSKSALHYANPLLLQSMMGGGMRPMMPPTS